MGWDMKNKAYKILSKLLVVVVSSLLFTSFSPSLDGRAVVVEDGVFPQGLFAKTVGYLPGDTISVTNVAGDSSVDLLVIGSLDPSEGVAIMLTPEAAAAIGIDKSENNIVKITKRSGLDERVYGNAIITKSDELPTDQNIQEKSEEVVEDEYDVEYNPADYHEEYVEDEEVVEDEYDVEYNPADYHEEYVEDEDAEEDEYDVEYNPADYHEEYVEDEEIEEEFVSDEELEDFVTEEFVEDEALEDELEANPVEEEIIEQVTEEVIEGEMLEDFEESEEVPAEEITEENLESEEVPVEQEFVETDELDNLEEESNIEEDFAESDEIVEEEYEAIVLVPVESNPPVVEADEEEVVLVEELESIVAVEEDTNEIEAVEVISEAISLPEEPVKVVEEIKIEVEQTSTPAIGYEKYIVPSLNDLESGKYYIQIASLRDDKNIEEIISKYANNYPIAIVPKKAGNIKQILVGPLSMDEYGVVLQRFKSYGYKDAFLRKIK